jgi:hypothetical protein
VANVDVPHGFEPWGIVKRARLYAVPTAPTIAFYHNDLVQAEITGAAVSRYLGAGTHIEDDAVIQAAPGQTIHILGTTLAIFDSDMDPIHYMPVGTVGDGTTAGYLLVSDDPDQQYEAQGDTAFALADLDLNYNVTSVALNAGNTKTGISTQEIAISGAAVTVTLPLRLYGQAYPDVDSYASVGCRMICQINPLCHYYGAGIAV